MEKISIGNSLRWLLTGRAIQFGMQLIGMLVLARLMAPEDFGLLALAGVTISLLQIFSDMGTSTALVQRENLTFDQINSVFWLNIFIGCATAFILSVSSPAFSFLFHHENLNSVIILLSLSLPITAFSSPHVALIERKSNFRDLTAFSTISSAAGLLVGITAAMLDFGVFSMVYQTLFTALVFALLVQRASKWHPGRLSFSGLRDLMSFSGNLFVFNLLNLFHRNTDTVIIGRFLGAHDLGLYNISYKVLLFPLQNLTFAVNRAILVAYSREQGDKSKLREHYIFMLRSISLVTAPAMAAIWVTSDQLVTLLLGHAWSDSAKVIQWLAPTGFFQSLASTSGAVLLAGGNAATLRKLGVVGVPFLTASFFTGIPWGIEGVAASYSIATFIWLFPVLATVMKELGGRLRESFISIFSPALLSAGAFLLSSRLFEDFFANVFAYIALTVTVGTLIYAIGAVLIFRTHFMTYFACLKTRF